MLDITDRKRAEETRRQLAAIVESSDDAIVGLTLDGMIVTWNSGAERVYGYSAGEIIGRPISILVPPDRITEFPQIYEKFRQGERIAHFETVRVRKDGRRIDLSLTLSPITDTEGKVTGICGIGRDITQRKRNEESFRLTFANNPLPMWVFEADTLRFLEVNDTAVAQYGYSRDEFLTMRITDIRPPDEIPELQRYLAQERPDLRHAGEWRHRRKDGQIIEVQITSHSLEFVGRRAVLVVAENITDRKRAEEALRASEERYRSLFEGVPVGLYRAAPTGELLDVNPAFLEMLGYPDRTTLLAARAATLYVDPDVQKRMATLLEREGEVTDFDSQLRRYDDGTLIWVRANVRAIRDAAGQILYYEGAIVDNTGRRQAEEALRESEERFRELFQNANDLVYTSDLEGHFLSVNRATGRVTGYTHDELLSMSASQLLAPEHLEPALQQLQRKMAEGETTVYMVEILAKDGRRVPLEASTRLIYRHGAPVGIQGIARDITERKQAEHEIRRRAAHLEALNTIIGAAVATTNLTELLEAILDKVLHVLDVGMGGSGSETCMSRMGSQLGLAPKSCT